MSTLQLNAIATRALLDDEFQAAILNGHRRQRLSEFSLSKDEIEAVMSIQANDVDQFIRNLGKLMHNAYVSAS